MLPKIKSAVALYLRLPRYRQIVRVFFKYGFEDVLIKLRVRKRLQIQDHKVMDRLPEIRGKSRSERFRMALEELGPTFVKFGQILSTRRDLIDKELFDELQKLQNAVRPVDGAVIRKIVEKELGAPISHFFKKFDEEPVASASIAQVHRATLLEGDVVAIKVQRPNIEEIINTDLQILMDIAKFLDRHVESIAVLNPIGVVKEFSKTIRAELEFKNEARNMERFRDQFEYSEMVCVPKVYRRLTTDRVLTMKYISGAAVNDLKALRRRHVDPAELSERISEVIFEQMFTHGFFHADPHPGNLVVLSGGVIGFYDFGMMGMLNEEFRQNIATMIDGLVEKNHRSVTQSLLEMSETRSVSDLQKLESDIEVFSKQYLDRPLKDLKLGVILHRLLDVLMEHKLKMKADFYLGIKALTQVEDLGTLLNPDLNFIRVGQPYATATMQEKYSVFGMSKIFYTTVVDSIHLLKNLPLDFQDLYQRFKRGKFSIPLEHRINPDGFEPLRRTLNHIANRLTNAILIASILICSSMLILAGMPPKWHDVPALGVAGLILGAVMIVRLGISVWKRGGL